MLRTAGILRQLNSVSSEKSFKEFTLHSGQPNCFTQTPMQLLKNTPQVLEMVTNMTTIQSNASGYLSHCFYVWPNAAA